MSTLPTPSSHEAVIEKLKEALAHLPFGGTWSRARDPIDAAITRLSQPAPAALTEALREIAKHLSPGNENVRRGDLIASIRDLAQAELTYRGIVESLDAEGKLDPPAPAGDERHEAIPPTAKWGIGAFAAGVPPQGFTWAGWILACYSEHREGCAALPHGSKRHSACTCYLSEAIEWLNTHAAPAPAGEAETIERLKASIRVLGEQVNRDGILLAAGEARLREFVECVRYYLNQPHTNGAVMKADLKPKLAQLDALLTAAPVPQGWQPIATADKDAWVLGGAHHPAYGWLWGRSQYHRDKHHEGGGYWLFGGMEPTHWHPLSAAPVQAEKERTR